MPSSCCAWYFLLASRNFHQIVSAGANISAASRGVHDATQKSRTRVRDGAFLLRVFAEATIVDASVLDAVPAVRDALLRLVLDVPLAFVHAIANEEAVLQVENTLVLHGVVR